MSLIYHGSEQPTLGVELEYQLVDRESGQLVSMAPVLMAEFPDQDWVKYELFQSTVEINTRICHGVDEVREDLERKVAAVQKVAAPHGVALLCAGTHPFARWQDQKVTENARYYRLIERMQWPANQLLIFGMHVHVGIPDGETSIAVINHLEEWLPHLLALTASSPFWEGGDTGLASSRTKIFEHLPTAGLPFRHHNWHEFEVLVESLIRAKAIEGPREIWWDVRPHAVFGTVEVRVCDGTPTIGEAVAMTALIQALIVHLEKQIEAGETLPTLHNRIVRENKWRAARWSTGGSTIVDEDGRCQPIAESIETLLDELLPVFKELGSAAEVPKIRSMVTDPPSYARQRAVFQETGDLGAVVQALIQECEQDQPVLV